jgi:hypothetical protein
LNSSVAGLATFNGVNGKYVPVFNIGRNFEEIALRAIGAVVKWRKLGTKQYRGRFWHAHVGDVRRAIYWRSPMKTRLILAAAVVASLAAPAFAADEYWVVQDSATKKCTIVDKKPTETTMTVVSPSGTVYKTKTEAETGMKTIKVCSPM